MLMCQAFVVLPAAAIAAYYMGFCLGGGGILIMTRNSTVAITNIIEIMVCFFICTVFTFPVNQ